MEFVRWQKLIWSCEYSDRSCIAHRNFGLPPADVDKILGRKYARGSQLPATQNCFLMRQLRTASSRCGASTRAIPQAPASSAATNAASMRDYAGVAAGGSEPRLIRDAHFSSVKLSAALCARFAAASYLCGCLGGLVGPRSINDYRARLRP